MYLVVILVDCLCRCLNFFKPYNKLFLTACGKQNIKENAKNKVACFIGICGGAFIPLHIFAPNKLYY